MTSIDLCILQKNTRCSTLLHCLTCKKKTYTYRKCHTCKYACYCSEECQEKDLGKHRLLCTKYLKSEMDHFTTSVYFVKEALFQKDIFAGISGSITEDHFLYLETSVQEPITISMLKNPEPYVCKLDHFEKNIQGDLELNALKTKKENIKKIVILSKGKMVNPVFIIEIQ